MLSSMEFGTNKMEIMYGSVIAEAEPNKNIFWRLLERFPYDIL